MFAAVNMVSVGKTIPIRDGDAKIDLIYQVARRLPFVEIRHGPPPLALVTRPSRGELATMKHSTSTIVAIVGVVQIHRISTC